MAGADAGVNSLAVLNALPDILIGFDAEGVVRLLAGPIRELTGWDPDDWIGRNGLALIHPDDLPTALAALGTIQDKDLGEPMEMRCRRADRSWGVFEVIGRNRLADPEVGLVMLIARDVTNRRRMGVTSDHQERMFAMVEQAPTILFATDPGGSVLAVSQAVTRHLGIDPSHVRGRHIRDLVDPEDGQVLDRLLSSVSHSRAEVRLLDTVGRSKLFRLELANLASDPVMGGLVICASDITELDQARQALTRLASVDPLTGLANRRTLVERLERWVLAGVPLALLYIDLDGFKPVNDRFGHGAGDAVLREMAQRMAEAVVDGELAARVGGDEFAIMLAADDRRIEEVRSRVQTSLRRPTEVADTAVALDASIGIASWDPDSGDADTSAEALLAEADRAMYAEKAKQSRARD